MTGSNSILLEWPRLVNGQGIEMQTSTRVTWLKAFLIASTANAPLAWTTAPYAQEQKSASQGVISFDVPAQPLARSLNSFARVSQLKLAYSAELTRNKTAPALQGSYTRRSALSHLLSGSGLTFSFASDGSVVISASGSQSANTPEDGSTVLETITITSAKGNRIPTASELEAGTYQGAGTSAYISQETIQRFRGSSPGDMLSGIPGVMNGENRNSGALDVNIRGMQGQGRSPVIIDGAMQETTVYRGYAGMAGRTYLDPDFIGGVSIEKGPSAAADGTGAIGGVVRARTLNANDIVAPEGTWGVVVKGGLSGNNASPPRAATVGGSEPAIRNYNRPDPFDLRGKNGSVVGAYRSEMFDIVAGYAQRENGNYFAGSTGIDVGNWKGGAHPFAYNEQVTNTSIDNTSYLLRGVFRPNENHTLDLSYMRYESLFGEMKPSQLMYGTTPYQTTSEVEADTYTARYRYNPESPLIDLRADLWATNVNSFVVDPIRFDYGDGDIDNGDKFAATLSQRWGLTLSNTSRFSGAAGDLAVSYGLAHDYEDFGKSKDWGALNEKYPDRAWDTTREGWREQDSVFANAEYKPQEWATFSAGLRHIHNVVQDTKSGFSWVQDGLINRDEAKGWAPSFSVVVEPVKGIQFYSKYAEALRAASPFEATEGFSGSVNPYTDLRPEHAHNTEVGMNLQKYGVFTSDDLFQAKAGWFQNDVTDYITLGSERLTAPDGRWTDMIVRTNIPKVAMQGIELSASYDAGIVFGSVSGTHYTDSESCYTSTPGSPVLCYDGILRTPQSRFVNHILPKRMVSATVGGRFFEEKLSLGARYTYVEHDPAYEVVDLFGSYRLSDTTTMSFTVDNLFDRYYVDALSLGEGAAILPSPGRTIRVNLVSRFGDGNHDPVLSSDGRDLVGASSDQSAPLLQDFNGDWSGFYIGADWGGKHFSAKGDTTAANGMSSSVASSEVTDRDANSIIGGLHAGYNRQFESGLVLGFEFDGSYSRGRSTQAFIAPELDAARWGDGLVRQADYRQSYGAEASGRLRVGHSFGRTLVYGTGGLGFIQEKQTRTQYRSKARGATSPYDQTNPYFSETDQQIRSGLILGGGLEFAFNDKLSLRTEYQFGYYPEKTFKFDRASQNINRSYASSGSTVPGGADVAIGREAGNTLMTHSVRVGLNYRF